MKTRRRPLRRVVSNCACRPLTWNSGTTVSVAGASARAISVATASGEVMPDKAPMKSMLKTAWQTARCDDCTALGRAEAPEVNSSSAGSSGCTRHRLARRSAGRDTASKPSSPRDSSFGAPATTTWQPSAASSGSRRCSRSPSQNSTRGCDGRDSRPQLAAGAEAVQRHRQRADERRGDKGDRPFGAVAHRDGDAVAGTDAHLGLQAAGQRIDGSEEAVVAPALALVGHELLGAVRARGVDQLGQRRRRVLVGAHRRPRTLDLGQLERRTGLRSGGNDRASRLRCMLIVDVSWLSSEALQAGVAVAMEGAVAEGLLQHPAALEKEAEVELVGDADAPMQSARLR
jgi:hypothetical protein